jgi:hypothetical protein
MGPWSNGIGGVLPMLVSCFWVGRDAVEPRTETDEGMENRRWQREDAAFRDVRCGSTVSRPTQKWPSATFT